MTLKKWDFPPPRVHIIVEHSLIAFLQWEALYIFTFHGAMARYEVKEKTLFEVVYLNPIPGRLKKVQKRAGGVNFTPPPTFRSL